MPLVYKRIVKFFVFFGITSLLFWLVYRNQNWSEAEKILKEDVDYTWIWVAIGMGLLSHLCRALRWQLLTRSMGYNIRLANSFMGVMIGYLANIALPRMGEFTRCGVVSKYERVPFSKLFGTVVAERVIDLGILVALTLVVVFTQFKQIGIFLEDNREVEEKIVSFFHSSWFFVFAVGLVLALYIVWRLLRKTSFHERLRNFWQGMKEGLLTVKRVKHKWLFVFYSLFIWLMYYLMFYVCFFCFEFTSDLGALIALTIFVLSSYGMVMPAQGGIGSWHAMVIAALLVYLPHTPGIENMCRTFALLTHGTMTLLYIVVGALCLLIMPLYNTKSLKKQE